MPITQSNITRTYSLPANADSMSQGQLRSYYLSLPESIQKSTMGQNLRNMWVNYGKQSTSTAAKPAASTAAAASSGGPNWSDISGSYQKALDSLTGDTEKLYQQGKRRTLSDIAMQSVNSGMANTLNMPAAGIAYDEANRASTNLALGQAKAGVLQNLGQTAAGVYGTNVGAQTQKYGIDVGAASDASAQALQKYIAQLNASTSLSQTAMQQSGRTSQASPVNIYTGNIGSAGGMI
ncbi:MAG: hypothetical protein ABFD89_12760 [Bryobacteraceae bacterium]